LTPVRLTKLAEADIANAAAWYENQKDGLGAAFVDRVYEAVDAISRNPLGYRKRIKDVRVANVPRFPFGLWFRVVDEAVVIGCLDHRRNPVLVKERIGGVIPFPEP
jgi:plasmid stabilization system protein ParE